jgi:hypothetical protein
MRSSDKPVALKNAPMEYAPTNELGVVFLFAHVARKLQFRIEEIRPGYPDCIAYRGKGDSTAKVRIEFEFRSSNFRAHRHDAEQCDVLVCWHHDWPDIPPNLEVIELKRHFGVGRKVWIQQAIRSQWAFLDDEEESLNWALSKNATPGDILLMYRCAPISAITDIYVFSGDCTSRGEALWREGDCYAGEISRLCRLASPLFLADLRRHKVIQTASFVRRNMQGVGLAATEYWPYLYDMILDRNPVVLRQLQALRPDRL